MKLRFRKVFKISTSYIEQQGYNFNLNIEEAKEDGLLINIANNQVFLAIDRITGFSCDYSEIDYLYEKISKEKNKKSSNAGKNIKLLRSKIDAILFQPYIINVKVDKPRVYKKICQNGFIVNGKKYVRLLCGAGMGRRSTVSFCSEEIYDKLDEILRNGIILNEINIAKWNAYYGLYMSGMYDVSTPKVCVVDDCELEIVGNKVDFIVDDKKINPFGEEGDYRRIEERDYVFNANVFDGAGLISPEQAAIWAENLGLDYVPANFIVRSAFIKGSVCVFDFKKFANEIAKKDYVVDHYGKKHNVNDIDVIITVSQFKMHKYYNDFDEYLHFFKYYNHSWGVSRYSPKVDKEYSTINYQYIQTLDLDEDSLQALAQPTIDWLHKICKGDLLYTLLFLIGEYSGVSTLDNLVNNTDNNFVKALLLNNDLFKDDYVRRKTYQMIETKINQAKIGRLWCRGNYQTMIPDPYAMAEWIFGMDVKGLLNKGEFYSKFWNDREVKKIDACRSPMVDPSEHNVVDVVDSEQMRGWYQYISSGIVMNIWGLDTIIHSDADFDGDIIYTTDNQIMIDNVYQNRLPITYDKESAPVEKYNMRNLIRTDLNTFDCKIGQTTNYSTKFFSMLCNYPKDSREYNELVNRIKLLRRYIGDSIDAGKGIKTKPFPKEWKQWERVPEDWSENKKHEQWFCNNLVEKRKPYFFIYIYPELKSEYEKYIKDTNHVCRCTFGCTVGELKSKQDKTIVEKNFVKTYYNNMPVTKTNCVMNRLAWMIEDVDYEYRFPKNTPKENAELEKLLSSGMYKINKVKYEEIKLVYNQWAGHIYDKIEDVNGYEREAEEVVEDNILIYREVIQTKLEEIISNSQELADYLVRLCYMDSSKYSKTFCWNFGIDGIVKTLKEKGKYKQNMIPIATTKDCGYEYLGKYYKLVNINDNI